MNKQNKIEELNFLLHCCLMPELDVDIGEKYVNSDYFKSFRTILDQNLVLLFDMIQVNEDILSENDSNSIKFQVNFMLMLFEQSSPYSMQWHQTRNKKLLVNIEKLTEKHFQRYLSMKREVNKKLYDYYKSKLVSLSWKKNIGSVFSFLQFLEIKYNKQSKQIEDGEITFILSVGLFLQDIFDSTFNEIGIKIFNILLNRTRKEYLIEMNIHNVIYKELRRDLHKDSVGSIQNLWSILILCLKTENYKYTYEKFAEVDYLVKDLLYQIIKAKSFEIWTTLMNIIIQLFLEFSLNATDMKSLLKNTNNFEKNIIQLRECCFRIYPEISFRWIKIILECLISESNYLIGFSTNKTTQVLNTFHLLYLICIIPINLNIIDDLIQIFWNKFSAILMEVIRLNKSKVVIFEAVKEFFKTFIYHIELQTQNICNTNVKNYGTVFNDVIECIDRYL